MNRRHWSYTLYDMKAYNNKLKLGALLEELMYYQKKRIANIINYFDNEYLKRSSHFYTLKQTDSIFPRLSVQF